MHSRIANREDPDHTASGLSNLFCSQLVFQMLEPIRIVKYISGIGYLPLYFCMCYLLTSNLQHLFENEN